MSPIQPRWVPPNVKFELDDAKAVPWPYPDNHFDLVHLRLLIGSISDWPSVYKDIFRILKPGGWVEHTEYDCDVVSDDATQPADAVMRQCTIFPPEVLCPFVLLNKLLSRGASVPAGG